MTPKKTKKIKILLTGGHAARTALAVIEELVKREGKEAFWDLYWVGSEKAIEGKDVATMESKIIPETYVKKISIITGRVQMKFTLWTIPSLLKIPFGMIHGLTILLKIKPDIVLSFGGYASYPIVVNAKLLNIPVVIHEQTAVAGRANIHAAKFANKIALSRITSEKYYPYKSVLTGNPIMTQMTEIEAKYRLSSPPVIYITGGSRGSKTLNNAVENILQKLLEKYYLIHQTGELEYKHYCDIKENLPEKLKKNYEVYAFIDPMKIDNVFKQADLIIGRAGANTVSDILASKRVAILIPIPFSYLNEQTENAKFGEKLGVIDIIKQENLNNNLLKRIETVINNWNGMNCKYKGFVSPDIKAGKKLVDLVISTVNEKKN